VSRRVTASETTAPATIVVWQERDLTHDEAQVCGKRQREGHRDAPDMLALQS